jgi:hypothetical protein
MRLRVPGNITLFVSPRVDEMDDITLDEWTKDAGLYD